MSQVVDHALRHDGRRIACDCGLWWNADREHYDWENAIDHLVVHGAIAAIADGVGPSFDAAIRGSRGATRPQDGLRVLR